LINFAKILKLLFMKKTLLILSALAVLAACGSGGDKKEGAATDTKPEVKTEEKSDAPAPSDNPDYKKGMAIVAKSENLCLTCHKIDEKLIGPAYRDVANKYENTEANVKMLAKKVKEGGAGVWGDVQMPLNPVISPEDAEAAVKYILLLRNK
jgi:cytochrome c